MDTTSNGTLMTAATCADALYTLAVMVMLTVLRTGMNVRLLVKVNVAARPPQYGWVTGYLQLPQVKNILATV